jgi:nucleoside 2-deoxyribosyltransferase
MMETPRVYTEISDKWIVDDREQSYTSPGLTGATDTQMLVFNQSFQDGTIVATLKLPSEEQTTNSGAPKVASLCFRFRNPKQYYFAGIGAFGSKFSLAKCVNGTSQQITSSGNSAMLRTDESYHITIHCHGSHIALLESGVELLSVNDEALQDGQWGLRTWKTRATFEALNCSCATPSCFVVMPFHPSFNSIATTIEQTITECGYKFERADLRFVTEPFLEDIKRQIARAHIVVIDLTGQNPNVYFEAGYAHALKKKVIYISQNVDALPSDVRHLRTLPYSDRISGDVQLSRDLKKAIQHTSVS